MNHAPPANGPDGLVFHHEPGFRLRRFQNWCSLGLVYASYYLCRYNLSAVAPELKDSLGFSNTQYGLIKGGRDIAYGLGQITNGLFTDRLGGKLAMTIGAIGTIVLNVAFGLTAWSSLPWLVYILTIIRAADGYMQAFGAPGMVKINAAWFRRQERGTFAGIFGGMIQLGAIGANKLAALLTSGFAIPLYFFAITVPKLDWRYMFIIPPVAVAVMVVVMNLLVKNHPEETGFRIRHDDEASDDDPHEKVHLWEVLRTIASNPVVWFVAGAYMCTGFVRGAVESWFAIYLDEVFHAGKSSTMFWILGTFLPISAFVGSYSSGLVSDKFVKGRRAPVAAALYGIEAVIIALALVVSFSTTLATPVAAVAILLVLNLTCNSTHSILGTAAAMDLGGRKRTGFSLGLINSFQYLGQVQAAWGVGWLLDTFGKHPLPTSMTATTQALPKVLFDPTIWFISMLPYATLGTLLMLILSVKYSRAGVRGA
jgi:OPA family glycerol-3-phosphate transporter-like MFS transporter